MPVFRYARERFPSDSYEFVIFHRGPLSSEHQQVIAATKRLAEDTNWPVNLKVRLVDLAAKEAEKPAWTPPPVAPLPWLVVTPPGGADAAPVWSGQLRADDVRVLVDSPARREVAHRLMKGESAVFLLMESGHKDADDAAAQVLQTTLAKLEKSLQLPPDDGTGRPHSALPLNIFFSILPHWTQRSGRTRPGQDLVCLKRRGPTQCRPHRVSGLRRGRILAALIGETLAPDALQEVGEFLCENCSCGLKGQLPGRDLLMAADWETILQGKTISEDSPALQGLGPLAQAAAAAAKTPPATAVSSAPVPLADAEQGASVEPPRHGILVVSLLATLSIAVLLIAGGSIFLKNRRHEGIH